jgi:prepilin-type N-terminal cleavage/methylation domain-containing protein
MICNMRKRKTNEKGFTLIEVIVSLVLVGIIAVIAGMGLLQITQGYVFAKQNAETVQKAQVAMTRIVKELGAAERTSAGTTAITAAGTGSVTYTRQEPSGSTTYTTNTIALSGTAVSLQQVPSGGTASTSTLINNVTAFSLAYLDAAGGTVDPSTPAAIRFVDITLTVRGASNVLSTFNNRVTTLATY